MFAYGNEAHRYQEMVISSECGLFLGRDNVRGQIFEHIFAPIGDCTFYIPIVNCMFLIGVHVRAYTEKILVTRGISHGISLESDHA